MPRPSSLASWGAVVCLCWLLGCRKRSDDSERPLRVAAASDLAFAFAEVGTAFQREQGRRPTFSFGSTGQLAKQIAEGAPYDLFAAANVSFADDVIRAGACDGDSKTFYARGRIVVWTKSSPGNAAPKALSDLRDPRYVRIAIANPDHAPYGRAAKQALEKAGIWQDVGKRIVYGENVQQTLQFAQTGNVEAAIVALSLVTANKEGAALVIDQALHEPIDQALVVCRNGRDPVGARAFAQLVASRPGRAIMRRHGFLLPGEALARESR